jgi:hypothetical protein
LSKTGFEDEKSLGEEIIYEVNLRLVERVVRPGFFKNTYSEGS